MLNKISLALVDESGNVIPLSERPFQVESRLDTAMIELWAEALKKFKAIGDEELRFAQKFEFINSLTNFLQEKTEDEHPF